jgi:hypothetical protein
MKAVRFKGTQFTREYRGVYRVQHLCCCPPTKCPKDHSGDYYPAAEVDAYRAKVAALVEAAKEVPKRYRLYRAKGVMPAPDQYQELVSAIVRLEAAIAAVEGE